MNVPLKKARRLGKVFKSQVYTPENFQRLLRTNSSFLDGQESGCTKNLIFQIKIKYNKYVTLCSSKKILNINILSWSQVSYITENNIEYCLEGVREGKWRGNNLLGSITIISGRHPGLAIMLK